MDNEHLFNVPMNPKFSPVHDLFIKVEMDNPHLLGHPSFYHSTVKRLTLQVNNEQQALNVPM